ncbi:response regulator [Methylocystis bryophila]|uniref:DNA-binding response regulator n=1 Tax=Methylocystis bryophila TaxID=655015 RepID=A0A1W6N207_9HYPH|nr:response regulator transcription factor [Methylocystis bryophila]ARN83826.1 DNA-binding response regulator [Methylocystis bryophila]BDV39232.1 DNA-binding response regulator [Methylocystis bryophila]
MSKRRLGNAEPALILVVDDDRRIRGLLSRFLVSEGYRVSSAASAAEATARLSELIVDLIVLDVMMPGEDGLAFVARLRAENSPLSDAPILMLTARSELKSRVAGFEAGVDDYLGKPFEPRELVLRIASILRRTRAPARELGRARVANFGGLSFSPDSGLLLRGEKPVPLTTRERELLGALAGGDVVSRRALATRPGDAESNERSVDVEIARLRRKIEDAAHLIQTVRGQGYRLILDAPLADASETRAHS